MFLTDVCSKETSFGFLWVIMGKLGSSMGKLCKMMGKLNIFNSLKVKL